MNIEPLLLAIDWSFMTGTEAPFWWAIFLGLCSGVWAIIQMIFEKAKDRAQQQKELEQKQAEMRRDQCSRGLSMINALLESDDTDEEYYSWDAMKMLDYKNETRTLFIAMSFNPNDTGRKQVVHGFKTKPKKNEELVDDAVIRQALSVKTESGLDEKRAELVVYVRECFDELYFRMGQLEDAILAGLVTFDDVKTPIDYYVGIMAKDSATHYSYLKEYGYDKTLCYLDWFDNWKQAVKSLPNRPPSP